MWDTSDFVVWAVLGQRMKKIAHVIYYATKNLTDALKNYSTNEKELRAVVSTFDKFFSHLLFSKVIAFTDHTKFKHLLAKDDTKPRLIRWILLL